MSVQIPESLERVLQEKPREKIYLEVDAQQAEDPRYPAYRRVLDQVQNADEEMKKRLLPLDENDPDGQKAIAEVLGISPEDVVAFVQLREARYAALDVAFDAAHFAEQWEELLPQTQIAKVTGALPIPLEKPIIVLFSADWCSPCQMMRPTFAMLSFFFDKANIYYCPDEDLRGKEGVRGIPQLVAYFPGGTRVWSYCGGSTQDLWEVMNNLVVLGASFTGRGMLVRTETGYQVEKEEVLAAKEASSDSAQE